MGRGNASERPPEGADRRGLFRLMLKLPTLRGQLQMLAIRTPSLASLCEAYEDASVTLEKLRNEAGEANCPLVKEYETICNEIETDVIKFCIGRRSGAPE